jgi:hypothetical protein
MSRMFIAELDNPALGIRRTGPVPASFVERRMCPVSNDRYQSLSRTSRAPDCKNTLTAPRTSFSRLYTWVLGAVVRATGYTRNPREASRRL